MADTPPFESLEAGLNRLRGEELSSVEFILDYVQLRFSGPTLTALTMPTVAVAGRRLEQTDPGFKDELCNRIGSKVAWAAVTADSVQLEFDDGSLIDVSLRPEDYLGPEAVEFRESSKVWVA